MKLSSALFLIAIGAIDARRAGSGTRRRAQNKASPVEIVPDSELDAIVADNGGGSNRCGLEEISGLVHISATYGVGGFAIEYNSDRETVEYVGPSGSTFDFDSCEEFHLTCDSRMLLEGDDADAVDEDKKSSCKGKDTMLYCPLIYGQDATFRITDSLRVCPRRKLQDDEVDEDMQALAGHTLWVTTPEYAPVRRDLGEGSPKAARAPEGRELLGYSCDLVATLQCAPNSKNPYFSQDSECAYGNEDYPLGNKYVLNLENCNVREAGGTGRH